MAKQGPLASTQVFAATLKDMTMVDKLIHIPNDDTQNC